ncbi:MAG: hypothetical protein KGL35_12070 [Bradyrhizobium sp.]|nr:hypothetical protein [Bradyrhizobium sp.]
MSGTANVTRSAYELAFEISPIILTGGIASTILGQALPIIGLVGQLASFAQGFATTGTLTSADFFAKFVPISGGTVISNAVATYPFANQQVAANAMIEQPLNISLLMIAPVKDSGGYLTKLAIFTALRTSLQQHVNAGGTFAVATPAYIYTNCLLTGMTDVTGGEGKQYQIQWQLDFMRPLVTQQQSANAYSALMSKLSGGQYVSNLSWSGQGAAAGTQAPGALSLVAGAQQMAAGVNNFLSAVP